MTNAKVTPQDRTALRILYSMMQTETKRTHPNLNYYSAPKPFDLRKTSQAEKAICKLFHLYGYKSMKITHVMGRQLDAEKVTYNVITGKRQTLDKAKYIPSAGATGAGDLEGPVILKDGRTCSLMIEFKNIYTNDRIRPHQLEFKEKHEADGGIYVVIHSLSEAFEWVDEYLHKKVYY